MLRSTAECPARGVAREGPRVTPAEETITVLAMGLPRASKPPTIKTSPLFRRRAVWPARASGRGAWLWLVTPAAVLALPLEEPPPPQPAAADTATSAKRVPRDRTSFMGASPS